MSGTDVLGLHEPNPSISHTVPHAHPYTSSISSSASSSSSSIFSLDGASSQSSISSAASVDVIWEHDASRSSAPTCDAAVRCSRNGASKLAETVVAPELRKHPRRTNSQPVPSTGLPCARPPPCLLRQSERKVSFVDNLVDSASQIVETIWPLSVVARSNDAATGCRGVLPLRTFIQETLRRSRTSYSTLQVALYYLIKIKPHVPTHDFTQEQPRDKPTARAMQCGRRMFLAALILASKYLQDRNYSARAWSKISGLNTTEINQNELMFLEAVDWRLHIPDAVFQRWTDIVLKFTPGAGCASPPEGQCWRTILSKLTPDLDTIDVEPSSPATGFGAGFEMGFPADSPSPPRSVPASAESCVTLSSNEATPTGARNVPCPVEPALRTDMSTAPRLAMARPPMLPTPQMTPQANMTATPAASGSVYSLRRPSIGAAMTHAQSMCLSRSTLDLRPSLTTGAKANSCESYPIAVRRSSLARSTSSASSPESMVSDVSSSSSVFSSRSSRSSSVSSVASGISASTQSRLAVQATRRCATASLKDGRKTLQTIASPIDEAAVPGSEIYSSPDTYSGPVGPAIPDLSNFSLGTPVDLTASAQEAAQSLCALARTPKTSDPAPPSVTSDTERRCRKRGRTGSDDLSLQTHVRHLIHLHASQSDGCVLPDQRVASSFLIPGPSCAQPPSAYSASALALPTPLSGPVGMKRACCGGEATRKIGFSSGMTTGFTN